VPQAVPDRQRVVVATRAAPAKKSWTLPSDAQSISPPTVTSPKTASTSLFQGDFSWLNNMPHQQILTPEMLIALQKLTLQK
jgi:hypothetical protein